jgi:glycosyltransferase involved in cell wall biosynthesis
MKRRLNIGLLMTYNEADVLPEMLEAIAGEVDAIYALDGSSDETTVILEGHPLITKILRDADVVKAGKTQDFHRQALLKAARIDHGAGHWYTLLHADEFPHDSPRHIIDLAEREGAGFVNWMAMQFFLHPDDAPLYDAQGKPLEGGVQQRVRWYSPFWIEVRQFLDVAQFPWQRVAYLEGEHGRVKPHHTRWKPLSKMPIFKHYAFRSPAQVRSKQRNPGFSAAHESHQDVFSKTAQAIYKDAHCLENPLQPNFGPFEMAQQGSLLQTFLAQKKLVLR